jgi:predicted phosphoadenosine phosphosulfate sulfurtransferase
MGAKTKIKKYIQDWERKGYINGIPDEAPIELEKRGIVPSYKMICIAIMKNPNNLEILGFQREKCKIYHEIKRQEIYNRPTKNKQLKLFL